MNKLPWFLHAVDAHEDEFIQKAMDEFGHFGYAGYFIILELIHKHGAGGILKISKSKLAQSLRSRWPQVELLLNFCSTSGELEFTLSPTSVELQNKMFIKSQHNLRVKSNSIINQKSVKSKSKVSQKSVKNMQEKENERENEKKGKEESFIKEEKERKVKERVKEKEYILADVSLRESAKVGDLIPTASKKLMPHQKVLMAYKIGRGFELDDKEWDKENCNRYCRAAKSLLDFFGGDWDPAADFILQKCKDLGKTDLNWNLNTIARHARERGKGEDNGTTQTTMADNPVHHRGGYNGTSKAGAAISSAKDILGDCFKPRVGQANGKQSPDTLLEPEDREYGEADEA